MGKSDRFSPWNWLTAGGKVMTVWPALLYSAILKCYSNRRIYNNDKKWELHVIQMKSFSSLMLISSATVCYPAQRWLFTSKGKLWRLLHVSSHRCAWAILYTLVQLMSINSNKETVTWVDTFRASVKWNLCYTGIDLEMLIIMYYQVLKKFQQRFMVDLKSWRSWRIP